jgi:hypothetical protein
VNSDDGHANRIARLIADFTEASDRFAARLRAASADDASTIPTTGGWSPAGVAWHVAALNRLFAGFLTGSTPGLRPAAADFTETPWAAIEQRLLQPLTAPDSLSPPSGIGRDQALEAFTRSVSALGEALGALTPDRARLTLAHPLVGSITALQIGDWARAHTIRHNRQLKHLLGR